MENPIKMDDLGVSLFSETSIYSKTEARTCTSTSTSAAFTTAAAADAGVFDRVFTILGQGELVYIGGVYQDVHGNQYLDELIWGY